MPYFLVAPNGAKVSLPMQPLRFGSDVSADVRLNTNFGLAPLHFLLQPNGMGFTLETLTPGFPVFVNEEPADSKDLENGDSIRAGSFFVKYEAEHIITYPLPHPNQSPLEFAHPPETTPLAESNPTAIPQPSHYLVPPSEPRPMSFGSLPTLPPPDFLRQEAPPQPELSMAEGLPPPMTQSGSPFFVSQREQEPAAEPAAPLPTQAPPEAASFPPPLPWSQRAQHAGPLTVPSEFRLFTSPPVSPTEEPLPARPQASLSQPRSGGLTAKHGAMPIASVEKARGRWTAHSKSAHLAILGSAAGGMLAFVMWSALEGCRPTWGDFTLVPMLKIFCYLAGAAGIGSAAGSITCMVDKIRHPKQPFLVAAAVLLAATTATLLLVLPISASSADGIARMVNNISQAPTLMAPDFEWQTVAQRASEPWSLLSIVTATLAAYLRSHREAR